MLWPDLGLSPLARGNPFTFFFAGVIEGPIPARTGQPFVLGYALQHKRAYPRSHGATSPRPFLGEGVEGLSPLARGNRHGLAHIDAGVGPIPARTGQPHDLIEALGGEGAYPRSHGATSSSWSPRMIARGLSPLARGNHADLHHAALVLGPIPARTGQPRWCGGGSVHHGAYPRSHGATAAFTPVTR